MSKRVIVIGAGPAGAAAARLLHEAGFSALVLEKEAQVGGRTLTSRRPGFAVDSGAIFVMGSYERTLSFLRRAGRDSQMHRWRAKTAIREGGRLYPVRFDAPASFFRLPQLTWGDRLRALRVVVRLLVTKGPKPFDLRTLAEVDNGESMEAWSRRELGDRVHEYVVRPLMEPLTGADLNTISRSFLIALLRAPHRTKLTVPDEGVDRVTAWQLVDVEVRCGVEVTDIRRDGGVLRVSTTEAEHVADAVVIATDAFVAADLGREVLPSSVVDGLRSVQAIALHHVAFLYRHGPWLSARHDLVVPVGAGEHSDIGVLLGERRLPGSAPEGGQVVSVYLDGPHSARLSRDQAVEAARVVLRDVYGDAPEDAVEVHARPYGLSTAAPGHYRRMEELLARLPADVRLAGDYFTQSGIEAAYVAGESAAREIIANLRT